MRRKTGWSDMERYLFVIDVDAEICRVCDSVNEVGAAYCEGCNGQFRSFGELYSSYVMPLLYGWEEIEEMKRQYAISVVEELLNGTT